MIPNEHAIAHTAAELIGRHGHRAPQKVVDAIVLAIRDHDLPAAKRWNEVGRIIDRTLAV